MTLKLSNVNKFVNKLVPIFLNIFKNKVFLLN